MSRSKADEKKSAYYRLVGPDGTVYAVAGQRWIVEADLESKTYGDVDDQGNLIDGELPDGCVIVEVREP